MCQFVNGQNLTFYGLLPVVNGSVVLSERTSVNLVATTIEGEFDGRSQAVDYSLMDLQLFLLSSATYKFNNSLKVSVGYIYQRNYPFKTVYTNEHRLWQQVLFNVPIGRSTEYNRLRIEERFINSKADPAYQYTTRMRCQFGVKIPFKSSDETKRPKYLNLYNEPCISTSDFRSFRFSEYWVYGGIGFSINPKHRIEAGYLLEILWRKSGGLFFVNLIQVTWIAEWNFTRKKND